MENVSIIPQLKLKRPTDLEGTIIIRGFFNRKPVAAKSTGYKVSKADWDHQKRRVCNTATNATLLNNCIQKRLADIQAELLQKEIMGSRITPSHITDAVRGFTDSQDFISFCKTKIEQDYINEETKRGYYSELKKLQKFKPTVYFVDIDGNFLQQYRNFLRTSEKNSPNTQWRTMKFLFLMVNKAMKQGGIIRDNPFDKFERGKFQPMPRPYLVVAEINTIENMIAEKPCTETVKAVAVRFLLMVYSGMRFGDAMKFDPEKHVVEGRFVMQYKKFSGRVDYKLHSRLIAIIEKVKQYPLKMSVQKFNGWLKVMGSICGISKKITSHTGRHTMGHMLAELNVPREKAKLIMAHRDDESLNGYYHISESQVDREIMKLDTL